MKELQKIPTGIDGLDEILDGGLPKGRPTLVSGGAGCGKTILGMQFLVNGINRFGEPGALITFEETENELEENFESLGLDLEQLIKNKQLFINEINLQAQDVVEIGNFDLEGLFAQIEFAIDSVKAKRIVIDGIEALFSMFSMERTLRAELKRLFIWLKKKEVTAVITGQLGEKKRQITKHGIEEYLSDCVILLDQRINGQIATRRLHIHKYRGTHHGTNEYPFILSKKGMSVLPITSVGLNHPASLERVSTGISRLDDMLGRKGFFRGSSILVSGTAGTGKSSFAAYFADAVCRGGGRCIYFSFEESPAQITRNMESIGLDMKNHESEGLLRFHSTRPTLFGLEMHLLAIHQAIDEFSPDAVVFDPISNLTSMGSVEDIKLMFLRLLDYLKRNTITAFCTNLVTGGMALEATEVGISSVMDTWILLQQQQGEKDRKRIVSIVKSRGMSHSNNIYSFAITDDGISIEQ